MAECAECKRPKASSGALSYRLLSSKEKKAFCIGSTECLRVVIAGLRAEVSRLTVANRELLCARHFIGERPVQLFEGEVGGSHLVNGEHR